MFANQRIMHLFYAPGLTDQNTFSLQKEESHHAVRVLRLGAGSEIVVVNGRGGWFDVRITDPDPRACGVEVLQARTGIGTPPYHLHIAMAPTKQVDRFEWFIEKSAEIGISEITPLICDRSERREVRIDRLERVAIAAMKQSLHAFHPVIHETIRFGEFIRGGRPGALAIAHCLPGPKDWLDAIVKAGMPATVMIGPEGDFTEREIREAEESGYRSVTLGESRLRTETAGLVACQTVSWLLRKR
jgi:16S rRNA (uracil1498-N3)-methyltransferase